MACSGVPLQAVAIVQAYFSTGKTTIAGYSISDAYGEYLKDVLRQLRIVRVYSLNCEL